ncbi:MAG TPA: hypothetical protein VNT02_06575, partial [Burkholderiales bacterium]|nr:hypothetical protein [Burkholderiales bacterium]
MHEDRTLVYDPVAPAAAGARHARLSLDTLAGRTVGFIDNAKPNFNLLADDLAELLVSRHGVAKIVRHRKRSAAIGAGDAVLDDLARQCDAVI